MVWTTYVDEDESICLELGSLVLKYSINYNIEQPSAHDSTILQLLFLF